MRDTPAGRQPRQEPGVPWDPWTASPARAYQVPAQVRPVTGLQPAGDRRPAGERRVPAQHRRPAPGARERSRWHWLLAAGVLIPLLTPLYNRAQPELLGLPFFYWCQIAFTGMAVSVTAIVQLATRKKRRP